MHSRRHERGFTLTGLAVALCVFVGTLALLLRMVPPYLEYRAVREAVTRAALEFNPDADSLQDLRTRIRKLLTVSQIYGVSADDMDIYRDKGRVIIDATYEVRFHILWRLDGVMVFDDLLVEANDGNYR